MQKVGILTFHCAHNYGAVLQAYALQQHLASLGYFVEIIDYRPVYITECYKQSISFYRPYFNPLKKVLSYVKMIFLYLCDRFKNKTKYKIIKQSRVRFNQFIETKLNLSSNSYEKSFDLNFDYDFYVIGSDQVWNSNITRGFDKIFFGAFKVSDNCRIITYAASMSNYSSMSKDLDIIRKYLHNLHAIGVRELELQDYLNSYFNIQSELVLDPTLLVDPQFFCKIATTPLIKEKYILVYSLGLFDEEMRIAKLVSQKNDIPIVVLKGETRSMTYNNKVYSISPEEFLGLFQKASFVVTASFHGTVFSIINNKPFYSIKSGTDKDSRLQTLLSLLNLTDRFLNKGDYPCFDCLDFSITNEKLKLLRMRSNEFLVNNLRK